MDNDTYAIKKSLCDKIYLQTKSQGHIYYNMTQWFLKEISDLNLDEDKTKVTENKKIIRINAYSNFDNPVCPKCGSTHCVKNGHKQKVIKDCTNYYRLILITLNIKMFKCKDCGKVFLEDTPYKNPYETLTNESIYEIMEQLKYVNNTYESIARSMHLSRQNIIDVFDRYYDYKVGIIPKIISFDEKSNNDENTKSPYIFVIVDFMGRKIYDILPSRHKNTLSKYFEKIPLEQRNSVKFITMDMWQTYKEVAHEFFKNAIIAVDSFHVMENLNRAMDKIRVSVMQRYNEKTENIEDNSLNYYLLKKFKYFFKMEFDKISDKAIYVTKTNEHLSKQKLLNTLLNIDSRLSKAYKLVQDYREFNKTARFESAEPELDDLIERFIDSGENSLIEFGYTLSNWKQEIINSFITVKDKNKNGEDYNRRLSSGLIEGLNSIIEQLQFNAKGFSNYWRMRNRIIYCINKDFELDINNLKPIDKSKRNKKNKKNKK